jgi:hypothetical protein
MRLVPDSGVVLCPLGFSPIEDEFPWFSSKLEQCPTITKNYVFVCIFSKYTVKLGYKRTLRDQ